MKTLYFLLTLIILIGFLGCNNLQKKSGIQLKNGDLLFQDLDDYSLSEAIERVTGENTELSFSHVGIVVMDSEGNPRVLEAISKGVCETPLDSFLIRSLTAEGKPKVMVGRLKKKFRDIIPEAVFFGRNLLGYPYDKVYRLGDSAYYCSELIYEMFRNSSDSVDIFQLNPMTFKDPETGEFFPTWVEYYHNLGTPIPEGQPGLNPNGMSRSENIDIIYNFSTGSKKFKK